MRLKKSIKWAGSPAIAFFGCGLLAGCALHPVNEDPMPSVSAASYSLQSADQSESNQPWWREFNSPDLDSAIRETLTANQNVIAAVARYKQARAVVKQAGAARLPWIDFTADADLGTTEGIDRDEVYTFGGLLTWEVDLFNRLGYNLDAREAEAAASANDILALMLVLSAEAAEAYYGAVEQRLQLDLLNEQIKLSTRLLDINQQRFDQGIAAQVDVLQQESNLAENEALLPPVEAALRVFENELDVLRGQAPDGKDLVSPKATLPALEDDPDIGVPGRLLQNRPDLRSLRDSLVAADSEIGRAIAERLPNITIRADAVYLDTPGIHGAAVSVLSSLIQPVLDWGARKAEVERNEALYEERLAVYTQAYLEAIRDVENALYQERKQREFVKRIRKTRDLLATTVEQSELRYTQGLTDYLPVIDALQRLQATERRLLSERRILVSFRIQLHRALGSPIGYDIIHSKAAPGPESTPTPSK